MLNKKLISWALAELASDREVIIILMGITSDNNLLLLANDKGVHQFRLFVISLDIDDLVVGELKFSSDSLGVALHNFYQMGTALQLADYL